jgi:hypothetical protein
MRHGDYNDGNVRKDKVIEFLNQLATGEVDLKGYREHPNVVMDRAGLNEDEQMLIRDQPLSEVKARLVGNPDGFIPLILVR